MPTDQEIALHQALIAVLIEVDKAGVDLDELTKKVHAGLLGNAYYRIVEPPHVSAALTELDKVKGSAQAMMA
ncbi:hypothetical protein [Pseudomonas putida]